MKLISWNVNGVRASSQSQGWASLWRDVDFDILCLQETKAYEDQLDLFLKQPKGMTSFWNSAEKAGYSGVAIYTREEPIEVWNGLGDKEIDQEGRVINAEFNKFILVNAYFPNSQRDHARLPFKLKFCKKMESHLTKLKAKGKPVLLCGDLNIAHKEIDLRNPKANENNAGFLPEERAWMDQFIQNGFTDAFRHFVKDPLHYTWWSYRPGVREKNIGWRLDYFLVNTESKDILNDVKHYTEIKGSDHCPVWLEIKN